MKFIFDTDWFECLGDQPEGVRLDVYEAVMEYAATGTDPELKPMAKLAFNFIKKQIDKHRSRYEERCERNRINGNKGGRPSKNPKEPKKPSGFLENPQKPTKTLYDNDNDNDNNTLRVCDIIGHTQDFFEQLNEYGRNAEPGSEYRRFLSFCMHNAPTVCRMLEPVTAGQFEELSDLYESETIENSLKAMENKHRQLAGCSSMYLTLLNFCKNER